MAEAVEGVVAAVADAARPEVLPTADVAGRVIDIDLAAQGGDRRGRSGDDDPVVAGLGARQDHLRRPLLARPDAGQRRGRILAGPSHLQRRPRLGPRVVQAGVQEARLGQRVAEDEVRVLGQRALRGEQVRPLVVQDRHHPPGHGQVRRVDPRAAGLVLHQVTGRRAGGIVGEVDRPVAVVVQPVGAGRLLRRIDLVVVPPVAAARVQQVDQAVAVVVLVVAAGGLLLAGAGDVLGGDAAEGGRQGEQREHVGRQLGPAGGRAVHVRGEPPVVGLPPQELPAVVVGVAAALERVAVGDGVTLAEVVPGEDDLLALRLAALGASVDGLLGGPAPVPVAAPAGQRPHALGVVVGEQVGQVTLDPRVSAGHTELAVGPQRHRGHLEARVLAYGARLGARAVLTGAEGGTLDGHRLPVELVDGTRDQVLVDRPLHKLVGGDQAADHEHRGAHVRVDRGAVVVPTAAVGGRVAVVGEVALEGLEARHHVDQALADGDRLADLVGSAAAQVGGEQHGERARPVSVGHAVGALGAGRLAVHRPADHPPDQAHVVRVQPGPAPRRPGRDDGRLEERHRRQRRQLGVEAGQVARLVHRNLPPEVAQPLLDGVEHP